MKKKILKQIKSMIPSQFYWYLRVMKWLRYVSCSDEEYIVRKHIKKFGVRPNLDNPRTFNEHQLKVILAKPTKLMTRCADKFSVREYVSEKAGKGLLNELYGVFKSYPEIEKALPDLPNQFVLKATHGASWNYICKDKSSIDNRELKARVNHWMRSNFYHSQREKVYQNIPPRVICEKYIEDETGGLNDYKVYCFYGEPKFFHIITGRYAKQILNTYDINGNFLPIEFRRGMSDPSLKVNKNLDTKELLGLSRKLSSDLDYVRVDFYFVENRLVFGELTFTSGNGNIYLPEAQDLYLGAFFDRGLKP